MIFIALIREAYICAISVSHKHIEIFVFIRTDGIHDTRQKSSPGGIVGPIGVHKHWG